MILSGNLKKNTTILKETAVEHVDETLSFTDLLEKCLVDLCKELDIPVPLWLEKNTREFVNFHRTFFSGEQFIDRVFFDKFEIRLEQTK